MRHVHCEACGADKPRRETVTILGKVFCHPCGDQFLESATTPIPSAEIVRNSDPTICHWCGADGNQELPHPWDLPTCNPCETRMRNWPYPTWLKVSFVALILLGVASIAFNYRFIDAYFSSRAAMVAFDARDLQTAVAQAKRARSKVPDFANYQFQASFFESVFLVGQEHFEAALPLVRQLNQEIPGEPMLEDLLFAAESGYAFEQHDYDRFLELAQGQHAARPQDRRANYSLASALACKFAVTGSEQFRKAAEERLEAVAQNETPEEAEYRQRILYRLTTRRIIDPKQFQQEFPQGWKPEE